MSEIKNWDKYLFTLPLKSEKVIEMGPYIGKEIITPLKVDKGSKQWLLGIKISDNYQYWTALVRFWVNSYQEERWIQLNFIKPANLILIETKK